MRLATPAALLLSGIVWFLLTPECAGGQPVFGATSKISVPVLIDPSSPLESTLAWQASIRPALSFESQALRFQAVGRVSSYNTGEPRDFELDQFELQLFPASFLSLRLGRFHYLPGKADLLSQTDFFARIDEEALISGDLTDALVPTDLLQIELYRSEVYLKLTAEPISKPILVPDPSSPWFPGRNIPKELSFRFPVNQTLTLGTLKLEPTPTGPFNLSRVSFSVEVGGSYRMFDGSLLYYHGHDYSPILQSRIEFPTGLYGSYDIYLTPVYPTIDAIGLDLSTTFWRMRAWIDSSYTLSKTFLTNRLSAATFSNLTAASPTLSYTAGASLMSDTPSATFSIEYSGTHRFATIADVVEPLFSSIIAGVVKLSFLDDRLSLDASVLVSGNDWSAVQMYSVSFNPSQEFGISAAFPLFTSSPATEFGQFSSTYQLTTAVTWRF